MHPNKVVVLKRHSPRRPSRDLSTRPTMGCRAKRILGRLDLPQITRGHDAWTESILIHCISTLSRSGIRDAHCPGHKAVRLLTLCDDD